MDDPKEPEKQQGGKQQSDEAQQTEAEKQEEKGKQASEEQMTSLELQKQLAKECIAMAKSSFATGLEVPAELMESIREAEADGDLDALAAHHNRLAKLVEPAKPRTILLLAEQREKTWAERFRGELSIVRWMMVTAILSTAAFVILSVLSSVGTKSAATGVSQASPDTTQEVMDPARLPADTAGLPSDTQPVSTDSVFAVQGTTSAPPDSIVSAPVQEKSLLAVLLCHLLLIAAAGMGASFIALFELNHYITDGTFDAKYTASYWNRFVLGLIAGYILAQLVFPGETWEGLRRLEKPLLALLGGFSSRAVYRILNRLVAAVETVVRGETRDLVAAQAQAAKARFAEQAAQDRLRVAGHLISLERELSAGPEPAKEKLTQILEQYMPLGLPDKKKKKKKKEKPEGEAGEETPAPPNG
jgi:hypothetical protein